MVVLSCCRSVCKAHSRAAATRICYCIRPSASMLTTAQQALLILWPIVAAARVVALAKAANDDGPAEYWVGVGSYDM